MKPFAIASVLTALGMAALLGAPAAQAQGFASYGAYVPTHEYFGYADYGFVGYQPLNAERRFAPSPSSYDPEYPGYSGWRRGDRLPEDYMTEVVDDYASVHLRKPPRGYAWFRDADDYILASENTGLIARVIHEE